MDFEAEADEMLNTATLTEKVGMMSGSGFFKAYAEDGGIWGARPYRAGSGIERLGIPPLFFYGRATRCCARTLDMFSVYNGPWGKL